MKSLKFDYKERNTFEEKGCKLELDTNGLFVNENLLVYILKNGNSLNEPLFIFYDDAAKKYLEVPKKIKFTNEVFYLKE